MTPWRIGWRPSQSLKDSSGFIVVVVDLVFVFFPSSEKTGESRIPSSLVLDEFPLHSSSLSTSTHPICRNPDRGFPGGIRFTSPLPPSMCLSASALVSPRNKWGWRAQNGGGARASPRSWRRLFGRAVEVPCCCKLLHSLRSMGMDSLRRHREDDDEVDARSAFSFRPPNCTRNVKPEQTSRRNQWRRVP